MSRPSWAQKTLLLFFSLFLLLLILEVSLRVGGFLFLLSQEGRNLNGLKDKDVFVVVCLGESTTALGDEFSYPAQLEGILNEKSKSRRIKIVNKGIPAINMGYLAAHLEENLNKYKPDLVITMLGVNDEDNIYSYQYVEEAERADDLASADQKKSFNFLRVVKLFKWLATSLRYKLKEIDYDDFSLNEEADRFRPQKLFHQISRCQKDIEKLEKMKTQVPKEWEKNLWVEKVKKEIKKIQGWQYHFLVLSGHWYAQQKDSKKAEDSYRQAIELIPENEKAYREFGIFLREQGNHEEALKIFQKALEKNKRSLLVVFEIARTWDELGNKVEVENIYRQFLKTDIKDYWILMEIGDWFMAREMIPQAKQAYLKAKENSSPRASTVYYKLSDIYNREGEVEKAQEFLQVAKKALETDRNQEIFEIYNAMSDQILNRKIAMISMQYPLRSIDPLRQNLKRRDEIIFVENKSNFERALKASRYAEYFYDTAMGDFGHCTIKGNRLIAEQVADVILRDVLKEE